MLNNAVNLVMLLIIILVILLPDNLSKVPIINKVYKDELNVYMLVAIVVLVALLDIRVSILMALLVFVLYVQINKVRSVKSVSSNASNNVAVSNNVVASNNVVSVVDSEEVQPVDNNTNQNAPVVEEFIRDTVPVVKVLEKFSSDALPEGELLTQQMPDLSNGYDVAGCRYDSENKTQNITKYGPALSDCNAYSPSDVEACGTLFYPLNA